MSSLQVNIGANISQLEKALSTAQSRLQSFGSNLKNTGRTLSTKLTAPIAGFSAVTVKAFAQQEKAELQLRAALQANGRAVNSLFNEYDAFAKQMQRITVVGDEVTLSMLSQAESLGLTGDAAQRAVQNSIAMQSAFGVNAQSALRYTAALEQGNATMLTRYIPTLREIDDESERVAEAQRVLEKAFSAATAEAQSTSGQLQQMKNAFGDFLEVVGEVISKAILPLVKRMKEWAEAAQNINPQIIRMGVVVGGLVAAIGPALFILGQMAIAISALMSPITLVIGGLGAFGVAIIHVQQNWEAFKERFSSVAWLQNALIDMLKLVNKLNPFQMLIDSYNLLADVLGMERIESGFENAIDSMRMKIPEFKNDIGSLKDSLIGFFSDMTGFEIENPFETMEGDEDSGVGGLVKRLNSAAIAAREFSAEYKSSMLGIGEVTAEGFQTVDVELKKYPEAIREAMEMTREVSQQFAAGLKSSIQSATISIFEGLGQMLAGTASFGDVILSTMASFASQLGKIIVGIGFAMLQLQPQNLFSNPFAAIAAGGALIALGAALKSLVGGGPSGAGGGGAGTGGFQRTATSVQAGGQVEFKISGDNLVGVLQNNNRSTGRVGRKPAF